MNKRMITIALSLLLLLSLCVPVSAQEIIMVDTEPLYVAQTEQLPREKEAPLFEEGSEYSDSAEGSILEGAIAASVAHDKIVSSSQEYTAYASQYPQGGLNYYYDGYDYDDDDDDYDDEDEQDYDDEEYDDEEYEDEFEEMGLLDILLFPFRMIFAFLFFL